MYKSLAKHYGNVVSVLNSQREEYRASGSAVIRKNILIQLKEIGKIREKALSIKRLATAKEGMAKIQTRLKKIKGMKVKMRGDSKMSARIEEVERRCVAKIEEYKQVIKAKGKTVGLSEVWLMEKKYSPYREFTLVEKKTDFRALNESFNTTEKELEDSLVEQINADLEKALKSAEKKLEAKDVAGLIALTFIFSTKLRAKIVDIIKKSFEVGKKTASEELKVERPITPTLNTQLMNMEADQIADEFSAQVERETKEIARNGLLKGLGVAAIIAAMTNKAKEKASQMATNLIGSVVGENVNKGRRYVFEKNSFKIKAYQRSEILDDRTCAMCMSLDRRIVRADDPMSKMDLVHSHCRGIWVPITQDETVEGSYGLPKTVTDAFDTIGGVPSINSFTQLKKPINKSNESVQSEIKRRIK